jgi:hypothetical protein
MSRANLRILPWLLLAAGCSRQAEQDCDAAFEARRGTSNLRAVPASDAERKQSIAGLKAFTERWEQVRGKIETPEVLALADAYTAALKQRIELLEQAKLKPAKAKPAPAAKPVSPTLDPSAARKQALREAVEFGLEGLLGYPWSKETVDGLTDNDKLIRQRNEALADYCLDQMSWF